MALWLWLCRLCSKIPIAGGLSQTTPKDRMEARKSLGLPLLISTAPIWCGTVLLFIINGITQPNVSLFDLWKCFKTIIQYGELFIYSASTLAPVIYIVTRERQNIRSFPSQYTFMAFVYVCSSLATMIFTFQRYAAQKLPDIMITFSLILYLAAIGVFFCALVYDNAFPPSASQEFRRGENDYENLYRAHRKQTRG